MVKAQAQEGRHTADETRWAALMQSAQSGNEGDYQKLLAEIAQVIDRYLRSRFGHYDFIEDCVQDILIAIHNARHTYDARRQFRPWMFAIVRYKAIDMIRKQKAYRQVLASQMPADSDDIVNSSQALENSITQGRLINALAPQYRQAITLTKLVGFTTTEAAKRLRISETALKVRVHRGIAKLKSLLEADAYE